MMDAEYGSLNPAPPTESAPRTLAALCGVPDGVPKMAPRGSFSLFRRQSLAAIPGCHISTIIASFLRLPSVASIPIPIVVHLCLDAGVSPSNKVPHLGGVLFHVREITGPHLGGIPLPHPRRKSPHKGGVLITGSLHPRTNSVPHKDGILFPLPVVQEGTRYPTKVAYYSPAPFIRGYTKYTTKMAYLSPVPISSAPPRWRLCPRLPSPEEKPGAPSRWRTCPRFPISSAPPRWLTVSGNLLGWKFIYTMPGILRTRHPNIEAIACIYACIFFHASAPNSLVPETPAFMRVFAPIVNER